MKSVIAQIPETQTVPLVSYKRAVGIVDRTFSFKLISMSQLIKLIDKMKPMGSAGPDNILMRMIKDARDELQPLILIMVNQAIKNRIFPDQLKETKIGPIEKKGKNKNTEEGWHPVNVIPALSKVLECVLLAQMLEHLKVNQLIGHSHHGAVNGKSTQTMINELYNKLSQKICAKKTTQLSSV